MNTTVSLMGMYNDCVTYCSKNNGRSWQPARLRASLSKSGNMIWRLEAWMGHETCILVKARDESDKLAQALGISFRPAASIGKKVNEYADGSISRLGRAKGCWA